jgi:hypothetical protein
MKIQLMGVMLAREGAGIISPGPIWVCYHQEYLYCHESLLKLLWIVVTEWRHDRHLCM